jgi:hypothetical protein
LKVIASILLLGLLLFNLIGYRIFINQLESSANHELAEKLDIENYDPSRLVLIKVPAVHLAYYTNSKHFERKDGRIEISGEVFDFVKWRLYNDTLEVLCIDDKESTLLQAAKNEFFWLVNDLQHNSHTKSMTYNTTEDFEIPIPYNFFGPTLSRPIGIFHSNQKNVEASISVIENPPERLEPQERKICSNADQPATITGLAN